MTNDDFTPSKIAQIANDFNESQLLRLMNTLMTGLIILDFELEKRFPEAHKKWHEDND
jgi:hypothetical protein